MVSVTVEQSTASVGKLRGVLAAFKQQNRALLSHVMPQDDTGTQSTDMLANQVSWMLWCVKITTLLLYA